MRSAFGLTRRIRRAIWRASRSALAVTVQVLRITISAPSALPSSAGARRSPRRRRRASSAAESAWFSLQPRVTMRYVGTSGCLRRPGLQGAVLLADLRRQPLLEGLQAAPQLRVGIRQDLGREDGGVRG